MNIFLLILVWIGVLFIVSKGYKALKNASIQETMKNQLNVSQQYEKVKEFQKENKGINKKRQTVNKFTEGGNNE